MIVFKCDACGVGFKLSDKQAGSKGKCPKCGSIILVPFSSDQQKKVTDIIQETRGNLTDNHCATSRIVESDVRNRSKKKEWQAIELRSMLKHWTEENPRSRKDISGRIWGGIVGGIACGLLGIFILVVFGKVKGSGLLTVPLILFSPCLIIYGLYYLVVGLTPQVTVSCPLCGKTAPLLTYYSDFVCTECHVYIRVIGEARNGHALVGVCPYCKADLLLFTDRGTCQCYTCGSRLTIEEAKISLSSQFEARCRNCDRTMPDSSHVCVACGNLASTDFSLQYRDVDLFTMSSKGHLFFAQASIAELTEQMKADQDRSVMLQSIQKRLEFIKRFLISLEMAAEDSNLFPQVASVMDATQSTYRLVLMSLHKALSAKWRATFKDKPPFEFPSSIHNRVADRVKTSLRSDAFPVWQSGLIDYRIDTKTDSYSNTKHTYIVTSFDTILTEVKKISCYMDRMQQ